MLTKFKQVCGSSRSIGPVAVCGIFSMAFTVTLFLATSPFTTSFLKQWARNDVEMRARLIFNLTRENLVTLLGQHRTAEINSLFRKIAEDEKILAVGFCNSDGNLLYSTTLMPATMSCKDVARTEAESFSSFQTKRHDLLVGAFPVGAAHGHFVILNDLGFAQLRGAEIGRYFAAILIFILLAVFIAATTAVLIYVRGWIVRTRHTLVTAGSGAVKASWQGPFDQEIRQILRQLDAGRQSIEEDSVSWDADTLRRLMRNELAGTEVIVVSNRQPYIHNYANGAVKIQLPASGLVAALEPVMRACGGTWIAHGSGTADRAVVDSHDRLAVPPGKPAYTLRRIWLSDHEQDEYYYGFANEGLWPLCHIAFERPIFRQSDWHTYKRINQRFADAVVKEAKSADPVILVQDYHFALIPRMIRNRLPSATIVTFWHIPWPNAETFSICPWKQEIIQGLLGSSILGFHTQFHCNNFFETVDRFIESRIDREHPSVTFGGHEAFVRPYPISIEWPPAALAEQKSIAECRRAVFARLGLSSDCRLAVGVERFDYTKGILDRLRAVDCLLNEHPEWRGRFVFYEAAAPTRSKLTSYRKVQEQTESLVREINVRHGYPGYTPIILSARHHEPDEVFELFRAADTCLVSSLHDGMNLVAKEFVAARDDQRGVLILSSFAGASRELSEAIIVNPYDANSMGSAIARALAMPEDEQYERMHLMRNFVRSRNVYRWAGQMLLDASRLRKRQRIVDLAQQSKRHSVVRLFSGASELNGP